MRIASRRRGNGGRSSLRLGSLATVSCLITVATLTITAVTDVSPQPVDAAPIQIEIGANGPLGPITVIGDSVLLGSALYGPSLPDRLVEHGWGPVRFRAGEGYSTGYFAAPTEAKATYWINRWRAEGWDARDVIVNLGANDSGTCVTSTTCARNAITHLLDAIGPGHRIWWPLITRFPTHVAHQQTWNDALAAIAAERSDLYTWDWPAEMVAGGYQTSDNIHLSPDGYRRRSQRMGDVIAAQLGLARRTGIDAPLPTTIGGPTEYLAVVPSRVIDTRNAPAHDSAAGATVIVDIAPHVPAGTVAVAVNLTATRAEASGFLTAHPCDRSRPNSSSVNFERGRDRAAAAVLPLSASGQLCVYASAPTDVIVDIQGAFVSPRDDADRLTILPTPVRLVDTRATGRGTIVRVPVPADATAVAVNVTATGATTAGYLAAATCPGGEPAISTVNFQPGEDVGGSAYVPVVDGSICVYTSTQVDVIVDLTGMFTADGQLGFVPTDPTRMIDTRSGVGGWSPVHGAGQTIDVRVVPPGVAAVTGTITIVEPAGASFLTLWDCGTVPLTSAVNASEGGVAANAATIAVAPDGRLCARPQRVGHTVFDITGWWVP